MSTAARRAGPAS